MRSQRFPSLLRWGFGIRQRSARAATVKGSLTVRAAPAVWTVAVAFHAPIVVTTITLMDIEFDARKDAINRAKHQGVSLAETAGFDIDTALVTYDDRAAPEDRWVGIGFIGAVLHVLVFTERNGRIRPISLRKAHKSEVRLYEEQKARYEF